MSDNDLLTRTIMNTRNLPLSAMMEYRAAVNRNTETPRLTVETVDNHIYFYADVDSDRCLALIRAIREADSELR